MKPDILYEIIADAAKRHGIDDDPDHEVGDLQDALRAAVSMLTEEQCTLLHRGCLERIAEGYPDDLAAAQAWGSDAKWQYGNGTAQAIARARPPRDPEEVIEDAIAISDAFHRDKKTFDLFCEKFAEQLGGFNGIYAMLVVAAKVFSANAPEWGVDAAWNDSVCAYQQLIFETAMAATDTPKFDKTWFQSFVQRSFIGLGGQESEAS